jgi:signal transduction histidine kinase
MRPKLPTLGRAWPLRIRLTVAFASTIALVLVAAGLLIFFLFMRFIDAQADENLHDRGVAMRGLASQGLAPARVLALAGERYAQVYAADGRLLATTEAVGRRPLLNPGEVRGARREGVYDTRSLRGTEHGVRLRSFALAPGLVASIGESRDGRDHELDKLAVLLLFALPGALLLSSAAGYQVAGAALRPVEDMRRRAASIGESDLTERLGEPGTGDELDRLARTLNALLARLQEALARERRIVGDASHELRTPISVLRTRLEVALRGDGDADELRAVLADARVDATRLTRLADDLLVLARLDQGRLPLRLGPVEAQELLEQAAERHRPAVERADRTIAARVEVPGGAVLLADQDRLGQILDNLVVNSLRYGEGEIELLARPASGEADMVELAVRDHGTGFPPGFAARAFERFSQGEESRGGAGNGLGLAIVEGLVRAQGGRARASDRPDGGAEIALELPLA